MRNSQRSAQPPHFFIDGAARLRFYGYSLASVFGEFSRVVQV
jgi:hypothetical protein